MNRPAARAIKRPLEGFPASVVRDYKQWWASLSTLERQVLSPDGVSHKMWCRYIQTQDYHRRQR